MDVLIIDGYNVINAWPELVKLKEIGLEYARDRLVQWMGSFAGFAGVQVITVFDAHLVKGGSECCTKTPGSRIIFSKESETADSVIEKLVYDLVNNAGKCVFVATADRAEQLAILGSGAFRMSVRELRKVVAEATHQLADQHGVDNRQRRTLESQLQSDVKQRLEEIRRRQCTYSPEKRQLD